MGGNHSHTASPALTAYNKGTLAELATRPLRTDGDISQLEAASPSLRRWPARLPEPDDMSTFVSM